MKSINPLSKSTHIHRLSLGKLVWLFAGIYCVVTYFFLREKTLNGHDPANYFLAIKYGFSLAMERPHAPGYPFFVFFGQQISSFFNIDPHEAILLLNKVFVFFGIVVCYHFVKRYWSSAAALIAVLLVACNPVVLFYSSVGEIYIYDLFFSTAILYLMMACRPKFMPLAFFIIGVSMGFRLPSVILLAPVIAVVIYSRGDRKEVLSIRRIFPTLLSFVLGMCTWLIPFYISSGGIQVFQQALRDAAELDSTIYQNAAVYGSYLLWSVNIGFIVLFFRTGKNNSASKQKKILLLAWFSIPTLFYIVEHYSKGHILLILPCFIIPIASHISCIQRDWIKKTLLLFLVVINLSLFFFMPFLTPSIESTLPKAQRSSSERI
ncbi:MAG: protein O-mannosyl-transferase family, partial [Candidatus Kapaibacterium sp.]